MSMQLRSLNTIFQIEVGRWVKRIKLQECYLAQLSLKEQQHLDIQHLDIQ